MAVGDILAVAIGADGWFADVTIEGLSTGGTYSLGLGPNNDPDTGTPKIAITVVSLGFDTTGAPTTVTRTVYGTKQVRKPYPDDALNEETASGGNVTVRVALSDYLYAKDAAGAGNSGTAPTAAILAAFYTQGGTPNTAASGVVVTNGSTRAYPKVVGNWSWPGYDKLGASFKLRAVAFHASAAAGRPVQCVKFTAADASANATTVTVGTPTVDSAVGDATPVVEYVATMDGSGLSQGQVVTCNFVAYPRIGDAAACLDTTLGTVQPTPLYGPIKAVCDKTGAYATSAVVVDPVAGVDATGAVAAVFDPSSPPAPYLTMAAAYNALRAHNNTTYGRNNCGGSTMYLREGTHPWVNGSVTIGTAPDSWLTITKFPTAARANVIIGTQVTGKSLGLRVKIAEVKITGQTPSGNISAGSSAHLWLDRCEINCPTVNSPPFYIHAAWYVTRCLVTSLADGIRPYSTTNAPPAIVRGNAIISLGARQILAYTVLGNTMPATFVIDHIDSGTSPVSVNTVVAFNRFSGAPGGTPPLLLRQAITDTHGLAVVQNLIEITTNSTTPAMQISADGTVNSPVNNVLVWHNVIVGQRTSLAYNEVDPLVAGGGLALRLGWSIKNNIFDDANTKHDTFAGSGYAASGTKVGGWSQLYGCGCSGNLYAEVAGIGAPGNFLWELPGLRSVQPAASGQPPQGLSNPPGYTRFVDRKSFDGTIAGAGGGDYHVLADSPAVGLQRDYIMPFDLAGASRSVGDGAGAYTAVATDPTLAQAGSASGARTVTASKAKTGGAAGSVAGVRLPATAKVTTIGRAGVNSTARPITSSASSGVGAAGDTATARPIATVKVTTLGRAGVTSMARPVTSIATSGIATPGVTTGARPVGSVATTGLDAATGPTAARPVATTKASVLGRAATTGGARLPASTATAGLGRAGSTAAARTMPVSDTLGRAGAISGARTVGTGKLASLGQAGATAGSRTLVGGKVASLGKAGAETQARTVSGAKISSVGRASAAGQARALGAVVAVEIGRVGTLATARPVFRDNPLTGWPPLVSGPFSEPLVLAALP